MLSPVRLNGLHCTLGTILVVVVGVYCFGAGTAKRSDSAQPLQPHSRRHVYVDVGGNTGDSVAAFLTVGVPGVLREGRDFDAIYVFEPNPEFASRYWRYGGRKYAFEFIAAAATARDGSVDFQGSGLGGTATVSTTGGAGAVKTIDFSAWLQRTVAAEDFVVCKIDAEGSEFEIVQRMVADGTLCLCDRLSIEWHAWLGSRASGNAHVRAYLDPAATTERFDAPSCDGDCFCVRVPVRDGSNKGWSPFSHATLIPFCPHTVDSPPRSRAALLLLRAALHDKMAAASMLD